MGVRQTRRKHKLKIKNIKRFFLSSALSLLILILIFAVIYSKLGDKKVSKNTNGNKGISTENKDKTNKKGTSSKDKKASKEENKEDTYSEVLINSVGDCTIGTDTKFAYSTSLPCMLEKNNNDFSYFFKNVSSIFKNDDLTIANLETTFTNATVKKQKNFNFKADPSYAKALKLGSIESVNISNNHIYDYLDKGFQDTKQALKTQQILYFGEGEKVIKNIKGENFGLLGYQAWSGSKEFLNKLKKDINELKSKNCTVIINFHWGAERQYEPNATQKNIAHFAIDNGADLIIGHHSHVIQAIEKYKNKIICYSMGNFCFGGNSNPSDKDTFILGTKFKFKDHKLQGYETKIIPCSVSSKSNINDYCPTPAKGSEKERILNKIKNLSPTYKNNIKDEFLSVASSKQ